MILGFYLYTVHMCRLNMTFKATVPICARPQRRSRWRIGPSVRKTPLERRLAAGQMSPQHLLQAGAAAPALVMHPISVADLLPQATAAVAAATEEYGDSIRLPGEITPLLL